MIRLTLTTFLLFFALDTQASEVECLALNIYHEARGEIDLGQLAVAYVTLNRAQDSRWPDTICGVVHQPRQFSWYSDGKSDRPTDTKSWEVAQNVARIAIQGRKPDPTQGAMWYHSDTVHPSWADKLPKGPRIGRHVFYGGMDRQAMVATLSRLVFTG